MGVTVCIKQACVIFNTYEPLERKTDMPESITVLPHSDNDGIYPLVSLYYLVKKIKTIFFNV